MTPTLDRDAVALGGDLVTYAARLVRTARRINRLPAGVRVISLLDEHGPQGVSQLAVIDQCSQPTMSNAVRSLVEQGWVTKRPDPADARAAVVELTDVGRAELQRVRHLNGESVAARLAALPGHSPADLAVAVAVLRDLLTDTEPDTEPPTDIPTDTPAETEGTFA